MTNISVLFKKLYNAWNGNSLQFSPSAYPHSFPCLSLILSLLAPPLMSFLLVLQLSEVEVNGQIEQVCEQVYSEMQSQAMEAAMDSMDTMDTLPMPGCFRMRSHSYVRAIDQGCAGEEEGEGGRPLLLLPSSPPRTSATTVRTIQSSTGKAVEGRN